MSPRSEADARRIFRLGIASLYAADGGSAFLELVAAAHLKAIQDGGQRDRQELFRQVMGAPTTSLPEGRAEQEQLGRKVRAKVRQSLARTPPAFSLPVAAPEEGERAATTPAAGPS